MDKPTDPLNAFADHLAQPDSVPGASPGGVRELRPIDNLRVCPACLVANSAQDDFCTACGTGLVAPAGFDDGHRADESRAAATENAEATRPAAVAPIDPYPNPGNPPKSRRWPVVLGAVAAVSGLAGAMAFAILWHSEVNHAGRLLHRLDAATKSLHVVRSELATTQARLAATSALSARRRAVLLQAQTVLTKVDPLLSDADGIKLITAQIQSARDQFASDSAQMTSDLLELENYEANPQNYPGVDQWALVNQVNGELETVRSDYYSLTSTDSSFSGASTKFGEHADAFTTAVRTLQGQLRKVAGS